MGFPPPTFADTRGCTCLAYSYGYSSDRCKQHVLRKKSPTKDLRKAYNKAQAEAVVMGSTEDSKVWFSQSPLETLAKAASKEAVHTKRRIEEKVGHHAKRR